MSSERNLTKEMLGTDCSLDIHSIDRVQKYRGGIMNTASEIGKKDAEACPPAYGLRR